MIARAKRAAYERLLELLTAERDELSQQTQAERDRCNALQVKLAEMERQLQLAIAAEAERKMDVVADEAFMEKTLGKDWRAIVRGDPEKDEL